MILAVVCYIGVTSWFTWDNLQKLLAPVGEPQPVRDYEPINYPRERKRQHHVEPSTITSHLVSQAILIENIRQPILLPSADFKKY
ncbi:MAG: hypothetical protein R3C11_19735 [Planctomycetaceae bacterium]